MDMFLCVKCLWLCYLHKSDCMRTAAPYSDMKMCAESYDSLFTHTCGDKKNIMDSGHSSSPLPKVVERFIFAWLLLNFLGLAKSDNYK